MPESLLESQLALLEPVGEDERGRSVRIGVPVLAVVAAALAAVDAVRADA
jgi:gluconate kinase